MRQRVVVLREIALVARTSFAVTAAMASISSGSHVAAAPSPFEKTVAPETYACPWTASTLNSSEMPNRISSRACVWNSSTAAAASSGVVASAPS
jgi:hypothetical protein